MYEDLKEVNGQKYTWKDGILYILDERTNKLEESMPNNDAQFKDRVWARFYLDEYFSDERVIEWLYDKKSFTSEEYVSFLDSLNRNYYHPVAEEIVNFLINFGNGIVCPNRWGEINYRENMFDPDDKQSVHEVVSELSFPMGEVAFGRVKQNLKCQINVYNGDHRPYFWEEGRGKNRKEGLLTSYEKPRQKGESKVELVTRISSLRKIHKTPIEFCDEFAKALKENFNLYKYHVYVEKDFYFYRKPDKEVIYYDIPETHCDWRDD